MKQLFFISLILIFTACKSTHTSTLSTPMYAPQAEINPIRADVDVDMNKKLSGEAQATYFLIFRISGPKKFAEGLSLSGSPNYPFRYKTLKASAAFNAVDGNADVIVHPNFIIEKERFLIFSSVKMSVSGYAGTFKKFYQVPYKDK